MTNSPYAPKFFGDKRLFKRVHGQQVACVIGANTIDYTVPYEHIKMTAIEVVGSSALDTCDLQVVHPVAGVLNQFAFSISVAKDFYSHGSTFDADLYKGLIIRIIYNSVDAKTVGFNYVMDEVK
jgi:hypothetical protein